MHFRKKCIFEKCIFEKCIFENAFFENFANFWRARSRLYQNEINMRLTAFFKLYNIIANVEFWPDVAKLCRNNELCFQNKLLEIDHHIDKLLLVLIISRLADVGVRQDDAQLRVVHPARHERDPEDEADVEPVPELALELQLVPVAELRDDLCNRERVTLTRSDPKTV